MNDVSQAKSFLEQTDSPRKRTRDPLRVPADRWPGGSQHALSVAPQPTSDRTSSLRSTIPAPESPSAQPPRIAIKTKGRILLVNPADILAVEAEGNYVQLQLRADSHSLRESISRLAEQLKSYGFVRIHRSVLVNASWVEEIRPTPNGEYMLRVTGGKEYMVSRTYKPNLKSLAQSWIGIDSFSGT